MAKQHIKRNLLKVFGLLLLTLVVGFLLWASFPLGPGAESLAALTSSAQVHVDEGKWLVFSPTNEDIRAGLIIYPGGRVDPRSYAPIAYDIAAQGYLVVIVPMPLNLAVFGIDRADQVIRTFPQVETWAIAGHSLGGSMAAAFVNQNLDHVQGLIFWASYPAEGQDFSKTNLEVLSISATQDGLVMPEDLINSRDQLPPDTRWFTISGGNHAQFGDYGPQPGDLPASITAEQQRAQIVTATLDFLADLSS